LPSKAKFPKKKFHCAKRKKNVNFVIGVGMSRLGNQICDAVTALGNGAGSCCICDILRNKAPFQVFPLG